MKKTIMTLAAAALLLASCIGGGALQSKEQAGYQTIGGVTSRSGDFTFSFKVQDANPMPLAVTTKGDEAYVSFTVKMTRTDEALKPNARLTPFYAVIHGRDAQDDVEFRERGHHLHGPMPEGRPRPYQQYEGMDKPAHVRRQDYTHARQHAQTRGCQRRPLVVS